MIFPLVNTATVSAESFASDRSGQQKKSWGNPVTINCLWQPTSGKEQMDPRDEFIQMGNLYVDGKTNLIVGSQVTDISDSSGNIIDPGPYLVRAVKNFFDFSGGINHKTASLGGRK